MHSIFLSVFFRRMLNRVCRAPINLYFDITPTGIILNRFSKDIQIIDVTLPFLLRNQNMNYIQLVIVIAVTAYNVIWVLAIVPFLLLILIYLLRMFSRTLKEASRIETISASPVLTHLNETLNGVSTIRAYNKNLQFEKQIYRLIDQRLAALIIKRGVQCWFNTRINIISVFVMSFAYLYWVSSLFKNLIRFLQSKRAIQWW